MATANDPGQQTGPTYIQSDDELTNLIENDGVVFVEFYADWCGPCKMLEPVLETLAEETAATVVKVDVDDHQDIAADHGVRGVPTMELYADGELVEQFVGVRQEDELRQLIESHTSHE